MHTIGYTKEIKEAFDGNKRKVYAKLTFVACPFSKHEKFKAQVQIYVFGAAFTHSRILVYFENFGSFL